MVELLTVCEGLAQRGRIAQISGDPLNRQAF
jgi:hypothetical protein